MLVILLSAAAAVRKNRRLCARILKIAALPASYIISHLCIMGFGTLSYSANRDLFLILIITCFLYCAALLAIGAVQSGREKRESLSLSLIHISGEAVKILQKMKTALKISGGGKDAMVSGKCFSAREEIEKTEL